jgi:hypothetical protein
MDRDQFAAGKSKDEMAEQAGGKKQVPETPMVDKEEYKKAIAAVTPNPLPNGRAVGAGHAAAAETLIPDSFIDSLNKYMPPDK